MQKNISLLGSTGSIGKTTLRVAKHLGMKVVALAARSQIDLLEEQARQFQPELIAVYEKQAALALQKRLPHILILSGIEGLKKVASFEKAELTVLAMSGSLGMIPAIEAIKAKKQIGLANKEVMVSAGELISSLAKEYGVEILPVDSEHSALFQCLKQEKKEHISRLILTASGGPFFKKDKESLAKVKWQEAMTHPNFVMGPKVTIDSSTMMNKGLEMIEARWLYDVLPSQVEAIIHPEQKIHSFVEFVDGSMLAQMSEPDMVFPIQYALSYPKREKTFLPPYDFKKNGQLSFFEPDPEKFLCFKLAKEAMHLGQSYPCFLNAANEVLVERFLKEKITWSQIGEKLDKLIASHDPQNLLTLDAILEVDAVARQKAGVV